MRWKSKWFLISLIVPGSIFSENIRKNFRYELVDIILRTLTVSESRFVIIEKIGHTGTQPKKCFTCFKKPKKYTGFNTMDFFLESKTEVGLSCSCGDFFKSYEFGFLNLRADTYFQFKKVVGTKLEQSIIDEWNRYGYKELKSFRKERQQKLDPVFYDADADRA